LRDKAAKATKLLVLFMDNPFSYADKLVDIKDLVLDLIDETSDIGLDGDNLDISSPVIPFSSPTATFVDAFIDGAAQKMKEILRQVNENGE